MQAVSPKVRVRQGECTEPTARDTRRRPARNDNPETTENRAEAPPVADEARRASEKIRSIATDGARRLYFRLGNSNPFRTERKYNLALFFTSHCIRVYLNLFVDKLAHLC